MGKILTKIKEFLLNLFLPAYCLNCQKEGKELCDDCFSLIDILNEQYCPFCYPPKIVSDGKTCNNCRKNKNLSGLFSAASYHNFIVKKIISQFKYPPYYVKNLSKILTSLIIIHFQLLKKSPDFSQGILIPIPLDKKKLKRRGFNQAEELARELSNSLGLPLFLNVLIKTKETLAQAKISKEERKKNLVGAFSILKTLPGKKIFLIDDVFTTGSTMEECAGVLKKAGAKEVWGVVVARD